jgi:hypothetical protein
MGNKMTVEVVSEPMEEVEIIHLIRNDGARLVFVMHSDLIGNGPDRLICMDFYGKDGEPQTQLTNDAAIRTFFDTTIQAKERE